MAKLKRIHPLGDRVLAASSSNADVTIETERFLGISKLVAQNLTPSGKEALKTVFGAELSDMPCHVTTIAGVDIAWLAPGEWLLIGIEDVVEELRVAAEAALNDATALALPLAHGRAAFRIMREGARAVLSSLMPLDFHETSFPPRKCARSLFGECGAFVQAIDNTPSFRLIVDQSYAAYAWRMLEDACRNL